MATTTTRTTMTTGGGISVREATVGDCETIYTFLQGNAVTNKVPLKVSMEDLRRDGFGQTALFKCLIAETNSQQIPGTKSPVGMLMYNVLYNAMRPNGKVAFIDDLYVHPDHRKNGVGKKLITALAKVSKKQGVRSIEFYLVEDNTNARRFYDRLGAESLSKKNYYEVMGINDRSMTALCGGYAAAPSEL